MSNKIQNQYAPDYAVLPGETLLETLESLGMSQAELANRTGRPTKTINEIIKGKASITPETALQLERVFGVPASFWNNLERNYRETVARLQEQEKLQAEVKWLNRIPLKAMIKSGWVRAFKDRVRQLEEVLNFFGVSSPAQYQRIWHHPAASFRKSKAFQSDADALACWLRKGELAAQRIQCSTYDEKRFADALKNIRSLTATSVEKFQTELVRLCAEAGVAVVFVPELPGSRASGATRWLNSSKALIQLSLRYKTDDHLWFTFFHEAAHILNHGKKEVFIEVDCSGDSKEDEANRFAASFLIPDADFQRLKKLSSISKAVISRFAQELGIAPGIIVGRLQHEKLLPPSHGNDLKRHLRWKQN